MSGVKIKVKVVYADQYGFSTLCLRIHLVIRLLLEPFGALLEQGQYGRTLWVVSLRRSAG